MKKLTTKEFIQKAILKNGNTELFITDVLGLDNI